MSMEELRKEPQPSYYAKVIQDLKNEIKALRCGNAQYDYVEKLQAENAALRQQLKQDVQFGQQTMQMVGRKDEKIVSLLSVIENLYDMIVSMDTHEEADATAKGFITSKMWHDSVDNFRPPQIEDYKHGWLLRATGYLKD